MSKREQAKQKLCFALDVDKGQDALMWVRTLRDVVGVFKVGLELFVSEGPQTIAKLQAEGARIFLDLKLHDIPNTVHGTSRALGCLGVSMFNVHAAGGSSMMKAAVEGAAEGAARSGVATPSVIAVTLLTSISQSMLGDELGVSTSLPDYVLRLASLAQSSGLSGVVASPNEVAAIAGRCGAAFTVVTPGIRPADASLDDQQRVATPASAVAAGASVLVVGRPIRNAVDPVAAAEGILYEIASVI